MSVSIHQQKKLYSPGKKKKKKAAAMVIKKNLSLVIPLVPLPGTLPYIPIPSSSSSACKVFNRVQTTKFCGQTMLAGQTKNLRHNPANPNPVNWVANTKVNENQ